MVVCNRQVQSCSSQVHYTAGSCLLRSAHITSKLRLVNELVDSTANLLLLLLLQYT
jgi:hypothetical protein